MALYRKINPDLPCLAEDDQGKAYLTVVRALGATVPEIDEDAPWLSYLNEKDPEEWNRLYDAAYRAFVPMPANIRAALGLTVDEIRKYAAIEVPASQTGRCARYASLRCLRKGRRPLDESAASALEFFMELHANDKLSAVNSAEGGTRAAAGEPERCAAAPLGGRVRRAVQQADR
jgi:hypothetical protein